MHFSDQTKKNSVAKNQSPVCPKCKFKNHPAAIYCEICFYPLNVAKPQSKKPDATKSHLSSVSGKKEPNSSSRSNIFVSQRADSDKSSVSSVGNKSNLREELKKPSVISGLLVLFLAIALWINFFLNRRVTYLSSNAKDRVILYDSMSQVKDVPPGLFSYGGALYFASLVAHGLNDAITQSHPDFNLRYTKPNNQDQSYTNGIKMLLDGELSFAFNGRSLTGEEYAQAELRNVGLLQVPIAIDGIVLFTNNHISVDNLTLEQVRGIFTGQITNWEQLGGENLSIVPVLLTPENIEILGIKDIPSVPYLTQYATNYTLAIREVIATPGAISFASASLIQNQQGIKVLSLAEEGSTNYVTPIVAGQADLERFKDGTYPLTRRLFIVIRQDGTPDQLAGEAYGQMLLSNQGQKIVEQSGFVPLYNEQ